MGNKLQLKKYRTSFNNDIKVNTDILSIEDANTFLTFCEPKIIEELINSFYGYNFYYFYGEKGNEKIRPLKLDRFTRDLVHNYDSGIFVTIIILKETKTHIKKNITLINNTFKNLTFTSTYQLNNIGYSFNVYYSYFSKKINISFKSIFLGDGVLKNEEYDRFVISIKSENSIKINTGYYWRALTVNFLPEIEKLSNSEFKLILIAQAFKLNNNNEFIANDLIYNKGDLALDYLKYFPKIPLKQLRLLSSKKQLFTHIYGFYYKILNTLNWKEISSLFSSFKLVNPNEHNKIISFVFKRKQFYSYSGDILFDWYDYKLKKKLTSLTNIFMII